MFNKEVAGISAAFAAFWLLGYVVVSYNFPDYFAAVLVVVVVLIIGWCGRGIYDTATGKNQTPVEKILDGEEGE